MDAITTLTTESLTAHATNLQTKIALGTATAATHACLAAITAEMSKRGIAVPVVGGVIVTDTWAFTGGRNHVGRLRGVRPMTPVVVVKR